MFLLQEPDGFDELPRRWEIRVDDGVRMLSPVSEEMLGNVFYSCPHLVVVIAHDTLQGRR
jgi:hypothetical protein